MDRVLVGKHIALGEEWALAAWAGPVTGSLMEADRVTSHSRAPFPVSVSITNFENVVATAR